MGMILEMKLAIMEQEQLNNDLAIRRTCLCLTEYKERNMFGRTLDFFSTCMKTNGDLICT